MRALSSVAGESRWPLSETASPFSNPILMVVTLSGAAIGGSLVGLIVAGALSLPLLIGVIVAVWTGGPIGGTLAAGGGVLYAVAIHAVSFRVVGPLVTRSTFTVMSVIDRDSR